MTENKRGPASSNPVKLQLDEAKLSVEEMRKEQNDI